MSVEDVEEIEYIVVGQNRAQSIQRAIDPPCRSAAKVRNWSWLTLVVKVCAHGDEVVGGGDGALIITSKAGGRAARRLPVASEWGGRAQRGDQAGCEEGCERRRRWGEGV